MLDQSKGPSFHFSEKIAKIAQANVLFRTIELFPQFSTMRHIICFYAGLSFSLDIFCVSFPRTCVCVCVWQQCIDGHSTQIIYAACQNMFCSNSCSIKISYKNLCRYSSTSHIREKNVFAGIDLHDDCRCRELKKDHDCVYYTPSTKFNNYLACVVQFSIPNELENCQSGNVSTPLIKNRDCESLFNGV